MVKPEARYKQILFPGRTMKEVWKNQDTFIFVAKSEGFVVPFKRPMTHKGKPLKVTWVEYNQTWYAIWEPKEERPVVFRMMESGFGICSVEGCFRKKAPQSPLCDYHKGHSLYTKRTVNKLAEVPSSVCVEFCSQWWDWTCKAPRTLFTPTSKAEELRSQWIGVRYYPVSIKKVWKFLCLEDVWWEEWRKQKKA